MQRDAEILPVNIRMKKISDRFAIRAIRAVKLVKVLLNFNLWY